MVVFSDGTSVDTIGGGRVEMAVIDEAVAMLSAGAVEPRLYRYHLTRQLAMCCGGEMEVFVEPLLPPPHLVICGGGHVGTALLPMARALGFRAQTALHDDQALPNDEDFLDGFDVRAWRFAGAPVALEASYVVVVTRDHADDQRLIEQLLPLPLAYLGLIGSARKIALFRRRLELRSDSSAAFAGRWARLHAPIGLSIGAQTPAEIAVAIAAELVQVRAARQGTRAKADSAPIVLIDDSETSALNLEQELSE